MGNETEIVDELYSEDETASSDTYGPLADEERTESSETDGIAGLTENKLEGWSLHVDREDLYMWVHDREADIVVVESPDGYDWWNIYDSTDPCVEGVSRGPYVTLEAAIDQLDADLPTNDFSRLG